jgi:hypothetical protein
MSCSQVVAFGRSQPMSRSFAGFTPLRRTGVDIVSAAPVSGNGEQARAIPGGAALLISIAIVVSSMAIGRRIR